MTWRCWEAGAGETLSYTWLGLVLTGSDSFLSFLQLIGWQDKVQRDVFQGLTRQKLKYKHV